MKDEELLAYIELAMRTLHFSKLQRENVLSETGRLLAHYTFEEICQKLAQKSKHC